jgi:membrane-bound lytic murein transglycosylase D
MPFVLSRRLEGMKLRVAGIIGLMLALSVPVFAETAELPVQGLESRIEFWKKVFTQYGEDDVIIHDRLHPNLIYDIATRSEQAQKISAIQQALDEINANLANPGQLSATAQQVEANILASGIPLTRESVSDLRDNVHTQIGVRERFRQGVIRSGRYLDSFQGIFEKQGIPAEIALLPLVESSFENRALSNAGAAGIWQFTRGTARLYLNVNKKVDERLDPAKATRAAARLLHDNYMALGSWPLAITAYNHGRAGMMRAQSEVGSEITKIIDGYRGPLFGYASMNFYSEFAAAVDVYKNYEQYFGQLAFDKPSTRPEPAPALTRVAAKTTSKARQQTASTADKYKVQKGDTLADIAHRFGTSVRQLMDANNLRNHIIYAGQILLVR